LVMSQSSRGGVVLVKAALANRLVHSQRTNRRAVSNLPQDVDAPGLQLLPVAARILFCYRCIQHVATSAIDKCAASGRPEWEVVQHDSVDPAVDISVREYDSGG